MPERTAETSAADDDDEERAVREPEVDRGRAAHDSEVGLEAFVEEDERDRRREHDRSGGAAIDESARRRPRALERSGRHRATIGPALAHSAGP